MQGDRRQVEGRRRRGCDHTGTMILHYGQVIWPECLGDEVTGGGNERDNGVKMELQVGNSSVMDQNRYWLLVEIHREHGGAARQA